MSRPTAAVDVARLQRAVSQGCALLAELGESPDLHADARAAVSRVSRLTAFGAPDPVLGEAVDHLCALAWRLEWRLQAVREVVIVRANAIAEAITMVEEACLTRHEAAPPSAGRIVYADGRQAYISARGDARSHRDGLASKSLGEGANE